MKLQEQTGCRGDVAPSLRLQVGVEAKPGERAEAGSE